MDVLIEAIINYFQQWTASQVSIFVGLFLVFLEVLKAHKKLDRLKEDSAKDCVYKPFKNPEVVSVCKPCHLRLREQAAKNSDDQNGNIEW